MTELEYLQNLDDDVLDTLSSEFIIRASKIALKKMKTQLKRENNEVFLNALDSKGGSLFHYFASLGYYQLFKPL